jgi:N utilization substance protein B
VSQRAVSHNMPRRRARELALQGLYQHQLGGNAPAAIRGEFAESPHFAESDQAFLDELWRGVHAEPAALVDALRPHLDRAPTELSPIERSILVIGAWELLHQPQTPYRVVINEAIELAKTYGGTDGHRFVNGVLDKLAARVRAPEIAASARERREGRPG